MVAWAVDHSRLTTKRHEGQFCGDGSVLHLNCGCDHTDVYICQNSKNVPLLHMNNNTVGFDSSSFLKWVLSKSDFSVSL